MIYTEEDLKQAYAMGYNEAVDDVNAYIESCDEESMEFSLDESYDNDDDYSAVEAAIMNETKTLKKKEHNNAIYNDFSNLKKKYGLDKNYNINTSSKNMSEQERRHAGAINDARSLARRDYNMNLALRNEKANKKIALHPGRPDKGRPLSGADATKLWSHQGMK